MANTTHLLWTDLETLGTDENNNSIIEWASILTDMDLEVIETYGSVVRPRYQFWDFGLPPAVSKMHEANGLFSAIRHGQGVPLSVVEDRLIEMLQRHDVQGFVMLAGSGVGHFDMRFIQRQTPKLAKLLAFSVVDVGVMRRFFRDVCHAGVMVPPDGDAATKTHRAMDDIKQHLSEAKHYKSIISRMPITSMLPKPQT